MAEVIQQQRIREMNQSLLCVLLPWALKVMQAYGCALGMCPLRVERTRPTELRLFITRPNKVSLFLSVLVLQESRERNSRWMGILSSSSIHMCPVFTHYFKVYTNSRTDKIVFVLLTGLSLVRFRTTSMPKCGKGFLCYRTVEFTLKRPGYFGGTYLLSSCTPVTSVLSWAELVN